MCERRVDASDCLVPSHGVARYFGDRFQRLPSWCPCREIKNQSQDICLRRQILCRDVMLEQDGYASRVAHSERTRMILMISLQKENVENKMFR